MNTPNPITSVYLAGPMRGYPRFNFDAFLWAVILGAPVKTTDVALCMIALKISRATWAKKRDNWVDIAGYAKCGFICEQVNEGNTQ